MRVLGIFDYVSTLTFMLKINIYETTYTVISCFCILIILDSIVGSM